MTITQLKYAVAIAEPKSMQEAAKKVFISQPNLSGAMKALEDEIGIQVFERLRSGTKLTSAGREFISYARQVLEQYLLLEKNILKKKRKRPSFMYPPIPKADPVQRQGDFDGAAAKLGRICDRHGFFAGKCA